jgi:hypothetical protein
VRRHARSGSRTSWRREGRGGTDSRPYRRFDGVRVSRSLARPAIIRWIAGSFSSSSGNRVPGS